MAKSLSRKPKNNSGNEESGGKPKGKWNKSKFWRAFTIVICTGIITGCIVASVLTVYVLKYIESGETIDLANIRLNYTTIVYAEDESSGWYEIQRLHGNENRIWVDYDQMPEYLVNAAIALEDKRFQTHQGVDWQRTVASFANLFFPIYEGKPGGSTITQQLIKNYTDDDAVRIDRKVREIFHAIKLEKIYSKEQIIEAYLNTISLGNNTNGVQAAANLYFDKDVSELTLAQSAAIVTITQNPTRYNPLYQLDNLITRQQYTLSNMLEQKLITQEEYDQAIAEELVIETETAPAKINSEQNWFIDQLIEDAIDALMEEFDWTYAYAENMFLRGGYKVYSTVDTEMQNYLESKYIWDSGAFPAINNAVYPESAFVVLSLDGQIKAIVGSNREKEGARLFNRARDALRHPGSTIKPLASYAPAMEQDLIYFSMLVEDSPPMELNGRPYPVNFYSNPAYMGDITLNIAIQRSTNTIPVRLQMQMGSLTSFNFMRDKLGFTTLVENRNINGRVFSDIDIAPMGLGEMTDGVTPLEMAAAYATFGNGGIYYKPYSFTEIRDSENNIVLQTNTTGQRAMSAETANVMNRLLQGVTTGAYGTGTPAVFGAMPIAGKTGTSDNDNNQWFIGVTPYYVGACWMGYDIPERISYWSYPPPIVYRNIMGPIHQNLPVVQFTESPNVVTREYCTQSGQLATEYCPTRAWGWYKRTFIPDTCALHDPNSPDYVDPDYNNPDREFEDGDEDYDGDDENRSSSSSNSGSGSSSSGSSPGFNRPDED